VGRTNPTYRDLLARVEDQWGQYRRGLRHGASQRFDRLFEYARRHADAASYQNPTDALDAVLLSIDLEQERRIDDLETRLDTLAAEVDRLDGAGGGASPGADAPSGQRPVETDGAGSSSEEPDPSSPSSNGTEPSTDGPSSNGSDPDDP
jgi:hypothetical protein